MHSPSSFRSSPLSARVLYALTAGLLASTPMIAFADPGCKGPLESWGCLMIYTTFFGLPALPAFFCALVASAIATRRSTPPVPTPYFAGLTFLNFVLAPFHFFALFALIPEQSSSFGLVIGLTMLSHTALVLLLVLLMRTVLLRSPSAPS